MLKSELIKENERLRMELSMVCNSPNTFESVMVIKREQQIYRLERAIWFGDFTKSEKEIENWHIIEELKEKYGE